MAPKSDTRTIGDIVVTTTQLPAVTGLGLQPRLMKLLGPTFGAAIGADGKIDAKSAMPGMMSALATLDGAGIQQLARELLSSSTANVNGQVLTLGTADAQNAAFAGSSIDLVMALWFSIEVNFIRPLAEKLASVVAAQAAKP